VHAIREDAGPTLRRENVGEKTLRRKRKGRVLELSMRPFLPDLRELLNVARPEKFRAELLILDPP
jgi:hypothetical protein